jgi:hypothetical protein
MDPPLIIQHRRVVVAVFENGMAIGVMDVAIIGEGALGVRGDRDRDRPERSDRRAHRDVIKVKATVFSPDTIGGVIVDQFPVLAPRVLLFLITHAFLPPIAQIVDWGAVDDIIPHAETLPALRIVGAIEINPISKDMGLPIGDVFVEGKERIENLLLHH